jgi:Spy/CpxP family protein refolding chaperone
MNRFAIAALAGVALLASASASQAQRGARRSDSARVERRREGRGPGQALFQGIQLSDAQKTRIKAIRDSLQPQHQAMRESMKALREKQQRPDSAMRQKWMELAQREQSAIRDVLTADQRVKFDENVKTLREHKGRFGRGHFGQH